MKVFSFECRNHPEVTSGSDQTKGTLVFEVMYDGPLNAPKTVNCPLCASDCGVLGQWRQVSEHLTMAAQEWRSKWSVAIGIWEKLANELGATKRKLSETATELLNMKTGLLTTPEPKKTSGDLN